MDNDVMYNPLAYDQQVLAEKLGMMDYAPKPSVNLNTSLKIALLQEQLDSSQRRIKQMEQQQKKESVRENFVGCGCQNAKSNREKSNREKSNRDSNEVNSSDDEDELDHLSRLLTNRKVLLFLIVLLVVFCVMQYFSYKSENAELANMMMTLMRQQQGLPPASPLPSSSSSAATAATATASPPAS